MKLGSLFDGSGGFPLAGSLCGMEPAWASEVEPYPIAVTRARFPDMKHLGDVSKIHGRDIEPVDVITFGSPCQDMSIAGKRAGIKNENAGDDETTRSGLFYEAARIIKEMREATNGRYPRYAVWENVPGAFSSNKGEDFRLVLQTLIQIVEPSANVPPVPKSGWSYYDCWMGDGWSLAYRTVDAQYWGVPQRRRRIYLVLDLTGQRAGEILFKRDGLRGYFTESGKTRERTPANAERSAGVCDKNCLTPWDVQSRRIFSCDGPWPAIYAGEGGGHGYAMRNVSRDLPTAIINSVSGLAFPRYWAQAALDMAAAGAISNNTMRSLLSAVNVDITKLQGSADRWRQFQALGGTHSGYYNNESGFADAMSRGKSIGARAVGAMGAFNEATEAMTRFAEYLATIDRMGDTYENRLKGIKNAAEVTVDFGRHGSVGKVINAWIPYWNPAVQGINKMWRSIAGTDQPGGFSLKRALGTVGRAATTTVVWEAILQAVIRALGRDDEWEQFSDRTKDTYYLIPLKGEHQWLKIPKNREWGAVLGTPFMRMLEYANGRENPFENYIETSLAPNFLPGWVPDIIGLQQFIDIVTNKDFAGRDIVPYSLAQGSRGEQWDEDTSNYAIWLANAWNTVAGDKLSEAIGSDLTASPMHLDFILSSYFGDFADMAQKAASVGIWQGDDPVESIGEAAIGAVTTPWVANELRSSQVVTDYFDLLDRLDKEVQDAATQDTRNGTDLKQSSTAYQARQAIKKLYGDRISELYKVINNTENESEQTAAREEIAALAQQAMSYYDDIVAGRVENPILDAEYADLPADVSAELIRLDGMTEDYSFTPSSNPSKTYSVPGQKYHQYQIETDEQKDQFDALYMENYGQMMSAALQTSEYQAASDTGKAEILEETRDQVLEATKEKFFSWLDQNGATVERKPLPIELPTEVAEEIYRLDSYTGDYSFVPSPSPSATYTDPRRSDKEYVLDDGMKEQFKEIYTEVYTEMAEELMWKSRYRSANDAKKAAMLEEMRSEVLDETKDRFFKWLRDSGIESMKKEKD